MTWIKVPSMRWSRNVFHASFYKVAVVLETPKQNGGILWLPSTSEYSYRLMDRVGSQGMYGV
jgi:hypothetical protein